jgi:hypothetical protein
MVFVLQHENDILFSSWLVRMCLINTCIPGITDDYCTLIPQAEREQMFLSMDDDYSMSIDHKPDQVYLAYVFIL